MSTEKFAVIIFSLVLFIICVSIYVKSSVGQKRFLPSGILGSMGLGISGLLTISAIELLCGNLLSINLCTVLVSLLGSLPAVIAMLFLNII